MESTLLPGSKKPTTEKERRSRRINLLLQMSPEPFFGRAALYLCESQLHGLLEELEGGSWGGSWARTCEKELCRQLSIKQPLFQS